MDFYGLFCSIRVVDGINFQLKQNILPGWLCYFFVTPKHSLENSSIQRPVRSTPLF